MAEKTINITVNTNVDTSNITSLKDAINETTDSAKELSETLTTSVDNSNESINETISTTEELNNTINDIDPTSIDEVGNSADNTSTSINDSTDSTNDFNETLGNLDGSGFENIKDGAEEYKQTVDEAANSTMTMVDAVASLNIANELTTGLMGGVEAAGSYSDTMVRLGYAMSGTSMSAEQAQSQFGGLISTMTKETGRGAGTIRNHLISMGNVGITNSKILQESFEGVSKASFQTGNSIDSLDKKFQTMVLSGMATNRNLSTFGLSIEDLAKSMNVSVDEASSKFKELDKDTRASVLSAALNMKYGADVTENYKNSYEHLIESVNRAKDYLIRSVGEAVLPYVIPAMETAANVINGLANTFKGLPAPIKGVVGGFGGLLVGVSAFSLALSSTVKIVGFAISPFRSLYNYLTVIPDGQQLTRFQQHLNQVGNIASSVKTRITNLGTSIKNLTGSAVNGARTLITSLGNALKSVAVAAKTTAIELLNAGRSALIAGANAVRSAAMWLVEKTQKLASAVASGIAAAAQWALNIAMSANPIMLVVMAIMALIAVLGYLYFNNETVRNSINALGETLLNFGTSIVSAVSTAVQTIISYIQGLWNSILLVASLITTGISSFISWFSTIPTVIYQYLSNIVIKVVSFGANLAARFVRAGSNAVNSFMSYISTLPARFMGELNRMIDNALNFAGRIGQIMWQAAVNAWNNFLNGLGIHSPGIMQVAFVTEMENLAKRANEHEPLLVRNLRSLADSAITAWGNPSLDYTVNGENSVLSTDINNIGDNNLLEVIRKFFDDYKPTRDGNGANYVFNLYGDMDSEERMERFLDAVRREIYWDNTTAGRTV